MQANRSNAGTLVGGAILIAFGLLALAGQLFSLQSWGALWPFIVIGLGVLFLVGAFADGKSLAGLAVPGSIITGVGLMLLYQNVTNHWESMAYFWTLIIMFVGAGLYLMGLQEGNEQHKQSGLRVMKIGFILFIVFGAFFELIFSSFLPGGWRGTVFPALLILLGAYLILSRSGLLGGKKSASSDSLPPSS